MIRLSAKALEGILIYGEGDCSSVILNFLGGSVISLLAFNISSGLFIMFIFDTFLNLASVLHRLHSVNRYKLQY